MKDVFVLFRRFLPGYRSKVVLNVLFNILGALFGVFSFFAMSPLLSVLLNKGEDHAQLSHTDLSTVPVKEWKEPLMNNLKLFVAELADKHGSFNTLLIIGCFLIVMVFLKVGFTYAATYTMITLRNNIIRDIRNKMYKKIVKLPLGYFSEERKGDIISRVSSDVLDLQHSVMTSLEMIFKNPFIIFISLGSMIFLSWKLTLFIFVLLPIAGGLIGFIGKSLKKHSLNVQNKMGEIVSTFEETLGGLRIIKGFNAEKMMQNKQATQNHQFKKLNNRLMGRNDLASPVSEFLGTIMIIVVLVYGGNLMLNDKSPLEFEDFMTFMVLFYSIINPAKAFSTAFYNLKKGMASLERVDKVLQADEKIQDAPDAIKNIELKDSISYKNVWFKYISEYVVKDVSFTVNKGETVALVGQSGSGKSTLADLLPRFWDIQKGSIEIDGTPINKIALNDLRYLMGIVNQEAILFNDTIFNNIAFGSENAKLEDVIAAARIANAHEFIEQTEDGYDSIVGDRGSKLSGGQRQRISIARAILKNPPILILDEATSALDTESERLVQDALTKLMQNRTSIVIAHRLSTIVHADKIVVLRDGEIVEQGKHNELLEKKGEYFKFYQLQNFDS